MRTIRNLSRLMLVVTCVAGVSCGNRTDGADKAPKLAEKKEAELVAPERQPAGATSASGSASYTVDPSTAKVRFEMEAPLERQDGGVSSSAVSGSLTVDLDDLSRSTGLVNVDISGLVIYQQRAEEEGAEFGERHKSDVQNQHMQDWLEIGDDAPEEEAKKNKLVQFKLTAVESVDPAPSVSSLSGPKREVTFTAVGEFRLHQRVSNKRVQMKAVFHYDGDKPTSVDVATVEPFATDLAEHDVRPRTAFGKLAEKTLAAMAPKVGKEAKVSVSFTATVTQS